MPKDQITEQERETMDYETESRINALQRLLRNSQADVVRAFEGGMTEAEYTELRETRKTWSDELATLLGETKEPTDEPNAPDVLLTAIEAKEQLEDLGNLAEQAEEIGETVAFVRGLRRGLRNGE